MSYSLSINITCLNTHGIHVTANNSTTNNVMLFFVLDFKIASYNNCYSLITMLWTREENILCHYLFGNKIIQNFL